MSGLGASANAPDATRKAIGAARASRRNNMIRLDRQCSSVCAGAAEQMHAAGSRSERNYCERKPPRNLTFSKDSDERAVRDFYAFLRQKLETGATRGDSVKGKGDIAAFFGIGRRHNLVDHLLATLSGDGSRLLHGVPVLKQKGRVVS